MKDNKLIAEFMGLKYYEPFFEVTDESQMEKIEVRKGKVISFGYMFEPHELRYHESWAWLMPVVDKIEEMGFTTSIKTSYARINPREMGRYDNYISFVGFNEGGWHSRNPCPSVDDDIDNGYESKGHEIINKRQAIYKAVVVFINWYNKNK